MTSQYIYGIIREPRLKRFSFPGVGDSLVYTINYGGIGAVVSATDLTEIDPTRRNVKAHTVVQEGVLEQYCLLPMGFGVVAADGDEVHQLLESNYDGLTAELDRLAGKIEVELKVFWEQEAVVREIQNENQELTRLKAQVDEAKSPGKVRELLIQAGLHVDAIVRDWKARYAELVYSILQELACEAKVNNPIGIKNLLNASFLIDRPRETEFREQVYRLDARFQGRMNFKYVGPLPPYNFISLKLDMVKC
jgi:hypothetical protein